jgi:ribonuclease Z
MRITGTSIGGKKSSLVLPDYKVVLDIGVCSDDAVKHATILVTHGHADHLAGIIQHVATRDLLRMTPSVIVVPAPIAEHLDMVLTTWQKMGGRFSYTIVPMSPGEEYVLPTGIIVRPFKTDHVVVSQGYALVRKVKRLKDEYRGKTGAEIGSLSRSGVDVNQVTEVVEVAYTGDTRITAFDREELIRTAKVLIHEATFVGAELTVAEAHRHGHTHMDEIAERADRFANDEVVLCHFSTRHDDKGRNAALEAVPEPLRSKVQLWVD